jgi:uncharacterized protein (TIGR03118 family)
MRLFRCLGLAAVVLTTSARADAPYFQQFNLVSDIPGTATFTDPNLKNPWGISETGTSPFWVSNQKSGTSTLYNTAGVPQALVVNMPAGVGGPTGQVANSGTGATDFVLSNGAKASFIFANLNGAIDGWNGGAGTTALVAVPAAGAVYTGLALNPLAAGGSMLYAADTLHNRIDVYNASFQPILPGTFVDPSLPAGATVYNIQNLGGKLYVTYELAGGGGVVNVFDLNGAFLGRIASNGPGGLLNAPWGVAIAPAGWGGLGGDLLVGNLNDGRISAFSADPTHPGFIRQLSDKNNIPFAEPGLWALQFGNGGNGGDRNTLYFAAGINNQQDGLFGAISAAPEPGSIVLLTIGLALGGLGAWRKRRRASGQ